MRDSFLWVELIKKTQPRLQKYSQQVALLASSHDNRFMLYFQGVKIYIPDGCKQETLLTALSAIKQL